MSSARMFEIAFKLGATVDSSMRRAFNDASTAVENVGQETIELSQQNGELTKSFNLSAKAAAASAVAITGIGAGISAALQATDQYNTAMKQLQASAGLSINEMEEMKEISKNLYNKNLGEDWDDLAQSISTVKSVTDLSKGSLEEASKYAVMYRDVFGEEVGQSIKATDTMMKNFGITAGQSYNLLAQGAQRGLNKSDELIDSANEYAPYFKTLGFSANQMFDVFSTGLKNGAFNLDKVGDAVKEFNIRSKDGSKTSMEAYKALGMNAEKMTETFAEGGPAAQKAFSQVVNAIADVKDPVEQNALAVSLFGTQAEDLEMKVIKSLGNVKSTFDMTKNTMEEIGAIKYDTVGNAIKGIGRQFETGILIPLGEKALPYLNTFANYLQNDFAGAIQSTKDVLSTVTPIVLGLATGILVYKGTLAGVGAAQVAFNAIQSASIILYRAHRAAMIAYAIYGGGLPGIINGIKAAMMALNGTMLANPFLLVTAAIAGLIVAFYAAYKMSDTFRNKVDTAFATVRNALSETIAYTKSMAPQLWQGFLDYTQEAFSSIKSTYDQFISYIGSKYQAISGWFSGLQGPAQSVVQFIQGSFSTIGTTIASLSPFIARLGLSFLGVTGPVGWVIAAVVSIGSFLYKLIKTNDEVRASLVGAWESIQSALAPVVEVFGIVGQTLLSMLIPAITEIASSFATLGPEFQKTGQIIRDSFVELGPTFAELGVAFSELFSTFGSLFAELGTTLIPILVQGFTSLMPVIGQLFTNWITLASIVATQVLPLLLSGVQTIFPMILSLVQSSLPLIVNLISTLIPVIVQIVSSVLPLLLQGVQMIFPLILSIIQAVLPVAISLIGAIIPVILMIAQTVLPLVLQVVQMAFPLILLIIQSVIPIITGLLQGVAIFLTNIVVPAIQFLLQIVQFVFPLIMLAFNNGLTFVTGILKTFTSILTGDWDQAWNSIKQTTETIMGNIVNFLQSINLFDIGKNMISGLVDGVKSMTNATLGAVGNVVNGVIKGVNWVLGKVGVESSLAEWEVPKYARGTKGHPGGLAILGDGGGPELFRTPTGALGLSPGKDTLMSLPKGTQVIPHRETQRILTEYSPSIPAYATGNVVGDAFKTGASWVKEKGSQAVDATKAGASKAKEVVVDGASKAKDMALDVFSYIQEPAKLLNKVLEEYGVSVPKLAGPFGDIAKGSFTMIKEKATSFLKEKLEGFGSWSGGAGAPADVQKWLTAAINITGVPMSWLGPLQTMAMKESGGNPKAINLWDSNFKAGHPSKGLTK